MKKIIFLLALTFAVYSNSFALDQPLCKGTDGTAPTSAKCVKGTTDCSNPNNFFSDVPADVCHYTDTTPIQASNVCAYIAAGNYYQDHAVANCNASTGAPINSGLIFLIIAGGGLAFFFIRKQQLSNSNTLSV